MILGVSTESIYLVRDFAQTKNKEFCRTSFLFNYIIGPVNRVLNQFRENTQGNQKGMGGHIRTRMQQLLQFDLTAMIIRFLINQYADDTYAFHKQTEIQSALTYIDQDIAPESEKHTPPNKISLILSLVIVIC